MVPIYEHQSFRGFFLIAFINRRALTIQLLDLVGQQVRSVFGFSEEEMPLVKVLEGGTWKVNSVLKTSVSVKLRRNRLVVKFLPRSARKPKDPRFRLYQMAQCFRVKCIYFAINDYSPSLTPLIKRSWNFFTAAAAVLSTISCKIIDRLKYSLHFIHSLPLTTPLIF